MYHFYNLKGFLIVTAAILAVVLTVHALLNSKVNESQEKENQLQEAFFQLEDENRTLNEQLELIGTDEFVTMTAMKDYSYMNKDDIRFKFTNPEALYKYTAQEWQILLDELAR